MDSATALADNEAMPRFVTVLLDLVSVADGQARDEGLGSLTAEPVKLQDNLTAISLKYTDGEGEITNFHLYAAGFLRKRGGRRVSMTKVEKLDVDGNPITAVHIESRSDALVAVVSYI